jgi:hypothetical protein
MRRALLVGLGLGALAMACATLGGDGLGDVGLPTAGVGPYRKLGSSECLGTAPFLLDDAQAHWRDPGALALEPGRSAAVALYAVVDRDVAGQTRPVIVRSRSTDGRSFFGGRGGQIPPIAIAADAPWEGTAVGGPAPLAVGGEIWLYYGAAGGIGLARSADGIAFTKSAAPVLPDDATHAWRSPSVARFPDGTYHLFVADGDSFYESVSTSGDAFPAPVPVLGPAPVATDAGVVLDAIDDPLVLVRTTEAGRVHVRVLYTQTVGAVSSIALAARYGVSGPLSRATTGPVYSATETQRSPAVAELGAYSLLYVSDVRRSTNYPSIAGAVAPALTVLPPADDYPKSP